MSSSRRETGIISQTGQREEVSQPGSAPTNKLRRYTLSGMGELNSFQHKVNRLFRTETEGMTRLPPNIITVEDITKGLGLVNTDEERILNVIKETSALFGQSPKTRVPRLAHTRSRLSDLLQHMKELDSDQRMEINRRALSYWRSLPVDYQNKPELRYKSDKMITLQKAFKPGDKDKDKTLDKEEPDKEAKGLKVEEKVGDKKPDIEENQREEKDLDGNEKEVVNDLESDKLKMDVNGDKVKMHDDVEAHLPDDADFEHHAIEHSKHAAGFFLHKDKDPERAEAHKQAANLHARVGNALASVNHDKVDGRDESMFMGPPDGYPGEDPQAHPEEGSPGKDVQGNPLPSKPDDKRNQPGQDSEVKSRRRMAKKDPDTGDKKGAVEKSMQFTMRKSVHKLPHVFPLNTLGVPKPIITLQKGQARGGKYYRRVPKPGGGFKYYYTKDQYDKTHGEDGHKHGPEVAAGQIQIPSDLDPDIAKKFRPKLNKLAKVVEKYNNGKVDIHAVNKVDETIHRFIRKNAISSDPVLDAVSAVRKLDHEAHSKAKIDRAYDRLKEIPKERVFPHSYAGELMMRKK